MEQKYARPTFRKAERLCGKREVEELFKQGNVLFVHPVKAIYLLKPKDEGSPLQLLISVPKKYLKRAVDRNRMKRLIREVYRQAKGPVMQSLDRLQIHMNLALIYTGRQLNDYDEMEKAVTNILRQLENILKG